MKASGELPHLIDPADSTRDLFVVQQVAKWLDSRFEIPGIGIRFGLDAIIGIIPGFGDALTSLASLFILVTASKRGLPRVTLVRMAANIAIDWLAGSIPLLGDLFDVAWKASQRNAELFNQYVTSHPYEQLRQRRQDWLFLVVLVVGLTTVLFASIAIAYALLLAIWRSLASSITLTMSSRSRQVLDRLDISRRRDRCHIRRSHDVESSASAIEAIDLRWRLICSFFRRLARVTPTTSRQLSPGGHQAARRCLLLFVEKGDCCDAEKSTRCRKAQILSA